MRRLVAVTRAVPLLLAVVLLSGRLQAEDANPEDKARTLLEQGKAARDAKDHATALRFFRESHETHPTASQDALLNMAECEVALGQTAHAFLHYSEFLRNVKEPHDRRAEVTGIVATMVKAGPWIRFIRRDLLEANTVVRIDGVVLGPITGKAEDIPAEPGEHTVVITEPTKGERKIIAKVEPGKRYAIDFRPKIPPTGVIGPQTGTSPASGTLPHWVLPSGIMLSTTGALSTLMVGALFANGSVSGRNLLEADCAKDDGDGSTCDPAKVPNLEVRREGIQSDMRTATGLLVAGGVLAAASVTLILVYRSKSTNTAFAPLVLPGGGGLSAGGRF